MSRPHWLFYLWGVLWSLPLTLLGLLLALLYVPRRVRWSDGCLEVIPRWIAFQPGAQTFGIVIFYADEAARRDVGLRVHERVHVRQAFVFGVFFSILYLLDFLWLFVAACPRVPPGEPRWMRAYRAIAFERQAYEIEYEVTECGLHPHAWGAPRPGTD